MHRLVRGSHELVQDSLFSMCSYVLLTQKLDYEKFSHFLQKLVISDILLKKENLYSRNVTVDSVSVIVKNHKNESKVSNVPIRSHPESFDNLL